MLLEGTWWTMRHTGRLKPVLRFFCRSSTVSTSYLRRYEGLSALAPLKQCTRRPSPLEAVHPKHRSRVLACAFVCTDDVYVCHQITPSLSASLSLSTVRAAMQTRRGACRQCT